MGKNSTLAWTVEALVASDLDLCATMKAYDDTLLMIGNTGQ